LEDNSEEEKKKNSPQGGPHSFKPFSQAILPEFEMEETQDESLDELPQIDDDFEEENSSPYITQPQTTSEKIEPPKKSHTPFQYGKPQEERRRVFKVPLYAKVVFIVLILTAAGYYFYTIPDRKYHEGMNLFEEKEFKKAVLILEQSASMDFLKAQEALGQIYYHGEGAAKDQARALHWFSQAAAQGSLMAQIALGNMYYLGEGVKKDPALSRMWLEQAASQGSAEAARKIQSWYGRKKR
jgi:hypothetical protein